MKSTTHHASVLSSALVAGCLVACAPLPKTATAWTVLHIEESRIAVPGGWSARLDQHAYRNSPWALWITPPIEHAKPIILSAGPAARPGEPSPASDDVAFALKDFDAGPLEPQAVSTAAEMVACGTRRAATLYVACVSSAPGHRSRTVVLWMNATDEQLRAVGGLPILAELAVRA
jgi:hypothetical protein